MVCGGFILLSVRRRCHLIPKGSLKGRAERFLSNGGVKHLGRNLGHIKQLDY